MHIIKGLAYLVLALLALGIGTVIFFWVIYNVFIETQPHYSGPSFILGPWSFGVSIPMIWGGVIWMARACRYLFKWGPRSASLPQDR